MPNARGYGQENRRYALIPDTHTHAELRKAQSLLALLIATCRETLLGLDASANVLDGEMTELLRTMVERSEKELVVLTAKMNDAAP